jgi:hypothetical protein
LRRACRLSRVQLKIFGEGRMHLAEALSYRALADEVKRAA